MRRRPVLLLILSSLALAVVVGAAVGRATRGSSPAARARPPVASVIRTAAPSVSALKQLQGPLRPLRESLAALLGRRQVGPRALTAPAVRAAPMTCAVAASSCSLHPCVEFATAAPSSAVAVLSVPAVTVRRRSFAGRASSVYRYAPSVDSQNRSCRAVPAAGQTRLVPVALTR